MQPQAAQFIHILWAILAFYAVLILVVLTAIFIPTWFICKKAGFSPWLAFITLIPVGHLILLYVLAFADWKVVPAPQAYWPPQPPYPPQPPLPPQG
jgi:cytochrome c biogenesis protein CcdA